MVRGAVDSEPGPHGPDPSTWTVAWRPPTTPQIRCGASRGPLATRRGRALGIRMGSARYADTRVSALDVRRSQLGVYPGALGLPLAAGTPASASSRWRVLLRRPGPEQPVKILALEAPAAARLELVVPQPAFFPPAVDRAKGDLEVGGSFIGGHPVPGGTP